MSYDTIIRNGRWFDGTGAPSGIRDIGIKDGRIAVVSLRPLDVTGCDDVVEAGGRWVLPGMVDVHTHYDVEVLGGPGLPESVRHGVTTVLLGSCSLSTIHVNGSDAGDLFGRVEAIPREHVIAAVDDAKTWTTAEGYVEALESRPLGPNIAAFIGHSDMRTAVMGLDRATRKDVRPNARQQAEMERMLAEALDAGFVGLSSQQLLFDKIDGETCRSRTLPSTYAKPRELRRLKSLLRKRGRVLQSGPDIQNPLNLVSQVAQSIPALRDKLKTSLLSAADVKANPFAIWIMGPLAKAANKLGGDFRWQHLPVPFEVYADGIDLVVFEEFGSGAAALHLRDEVERNALLADEEYRRQFRKDYDSKYGVRVWHRDFFDAEIVACPDESVVGKSFGQVGMERGELHPVDAFLDLVLEHGTKLRWRTTISNHRPEVLKKLARHPGVQMGFSDAGAHLRNMAFYKYGLRLLRHVRDAERKGRPFMSVEQAVHRMTGELADWYQIDAGHLRVGDRADLVVVNPKYLDSHLDDYAEAPVEQYANLPRMVNRNNDAVELVLIGGRAVVPDGEPTPLLGSERTGSFLRVGRTTPAPGTTTTESELAHVN
ncbi:N-acyl-D-amino-acid deacylase family protein [Mycolicibacterium pallens]|uniref:Amidohydrolase family protein n=1 Tax=Mycolicibacterium pallens TaxID=370524 RepID=A0ABX8VAF1_9MYCO|nr:amidohydrolase family protein [Mycolicibacterium pallens]QYL14662.1 amidohydrolase family protein [Mycolicibacterium pallens]